MYSLFYQSHSWSGNCPYLPITFPRPCNPTRGWTRPLSNSWIDHFGNRSPPKTANQSRSHLDYVNIARIHFISQIVHDRGQGRRPPSSPEVKWNSIPKFLPFSPTTWCHIFHSRIFSVPTWLRLCVF